MKIGRNDPCPCGSGKKYKRCCLTTNYDKTGMEESIWKRLVQDLLRFFESHYQDSIEDALAIFWGDFNPMQYLDRESLLKAEINFMEWILYDFIIDEEDEKTLIDLYLENIRISSPDEHRILTMMRDSVISLYEVQEVFPEKGLLLKDILFGGKYDVKEKAATRSLRKWDVFAARLLHIDGSYIMSGSVYPYTLKQKQRLLDDIQEAFKDYKKDFPNDTLYDFLKTNSELFNFYWYYPIQNPQPLKLYTTNGEPMIFSKAIFEIIDKDAAMKGITCIKEFEQNKNGFVWLGKRDKKGSAIVLGNITIKDNKLILECTSKKRLEKGKKLIIKHLADVVIHKMDTFQDPMQLLKSYEGKHEKKEDNEIPIEIQQQLYSQFMQKHSEKWLNEKIPVLDGRTPMQAVKTAEGKQKVIELLKSFENIEEHNKREGRPFYDMSWMWDKLGLEREE